MINVIPLLLLWLVASVSFAITEGLFIPNRKKTKIMRWQCMDHSPPLISEGVNMDLDRMQFWYRNRDTHVEAWKMGLISQTPAMYQTQKFFAEHPYCNLKIVVDNVINEKESTSGCKSTLYL